MIPTETPAELVLRLLRLRPSSTQQLREHMRVERDYASAQTESLLAELRDEGTIAFTNGEWYVKGSTRATRKKGAPSADVRQTDFFDPEADHRPFSRETQELFERWRGTKRCLR